MAGFFGFHTQHQSPLTHERDMQINEVLQAFPQTKIVNAERTVLDLPLELRDRKVTALRCVLPQHFPQEAPVLSVLTPVAAPCVDAAGRVHTPQLGSWTYGHSRLRDAVAQASHALAASSGSSSPVRHGAGAGAAPYTPHTGGAAPAGPLTAHRPQSQPPQPTLASGPAPSGAAGTSSLQRPPASPHTPGSTATAASDSFRGDLASLTTAELEQLLSNREARQACILQAVSSCPAAEQLQAVRAATCAAATTNEGLVRAIKEARNQVAIVQGSEYSDARSRCDSLHARQQAVLALLAPTRIREKLEEAVSEADASSEALLSAFVRGDLAAEQFIDDYVELRTNFHVLDLKRQAAERLLA